MARKQDLEDLLALILVLFFIIISIYAIISLDREVELVLSQEATLLAIIFALSVLFLSFEGIHENDTVIVLIVMVIIVITTMSAVSLTRIPSDVR